MNPVPSMSSSGFSNSAWQALERAAVKRRSAATVLRLLTRLVQPTGSARSADAVRPHGALPPRSMETSLPHAIDAPFEQWAALTDAYAEQFLRMQRGDKTARDKAMCLSNAMLRMNEAMKCEA
ncbi:hypothetical protein [Variovorax sp. PvP013]|uniref:hypothetical protein n=1 Tax=Variovorax sp. PvP013 TaxID=3156435 RepID=UPI003D21106F